MNTILLLQIAIVGAFLINLTFRAAQRFFIIPLHDWREKIEKVVNYPSAIYLKVGKKRSSYRRRLVLASRKPSFYTNYVSNKLKIDDGDKELKTEFLESMKHRQPQDKQRKIIYGFFHPYASNGGGGERVLWLAVKATLAASDQNLCVLYVTSELEPLQILKKAEEKFKVEELDHKRIIFIYLRKYSAWIDSNFWPNVTLLGQLIGSFMLSMEALYELTPDIWIDTMGLPGSYIAVSWILNLPILSYVHYPIIQDEMFSKLKFQKFSLAEFAKFKFTISDVRQALKLVYWSILYYFYAYLGSLVNLALTNGSWTYDHIANIWGNSSRNDTRIEILYPPCGTEKLVKSHSEGIRKNTILYIAQFRAEKRHSLVLSHYHKFLEKSKKANLRIETLPRLSFLGSCRTPDDTAVLNSIKEKVKELEIEAYVDFTIDCSYDEVLANLSTSKFGLNAMWNEHFGIGVVEYLGRGVIPLCHASAGPYLDIVTGGNDGKNKWLNEVGYFFKDKSDPDYQESLQTGSPEGFLVFNDPRDRETLIEMPDLETLLSTLFITRRELSADALLADMRSKGMALVESKFSNEAFVKNWVSSCDMLKKIEVSNREDRKSDTEKFF